MSEGPYELVRTDTGITARIHARGHAVLASPTINRGTAFTAEQRRELGLTGLAEYQEAKHIWHNTAPAPQLWFSH